MKRTYYLTDYQKEFLAANYERLPQRYMAHVLHLNQAAITYWLRTNGYKRERKKGTVFIEGEFFEHDPTITTI